MDPVTSAAEAFADDENVTVRDLGNGLEEITLTLTGMVYDEDQP